MKIVYVACSKGQQIYVWQVSSVGELNLLQVVDTVGEVQPLVVSADKRFLYAGVRADCAVVSYQIQSDGRLFEMQRSAVPMAATANCLDVSGQYYLQASYGHNGLTVSPINSQGIAQPASQVLKGLGKAHCVIAIADVGIEPNKAQLNQQTIFVPCLADDAIKMYRFDQQGHLYPHPQVSLPTAIGAGPRHIVADSTGRHLYVINELDGDVLHFGYQAEIDQPSRWQLKQTLSYMPADFSGPHWAADLALTADDSYLYVTERTDNSLALFAIDPASGNLSYQQSITTEAVPRGFTLDPDNQILLCVGQESYHLSLYHIEQQTRQLSLLQRYPVGEQPLWLRCIEL